MPDPSTQLTLLQASILGLVEGITEYLPVSSTGHLILTAALMGLNQTPEQQAAVDTFNIVIQGGAIAAVLGLYWPTVVRMLRGVVGRDEAGRKLLINLVIAFIPAAVIGLMLDDLIEAYLFRAGPVLLALALGAFFMMLVDMRASGRLGLRGKFGSEPGIYDLSPKQALFIGFMQCVAMWPGTSRSMMTISGGILAGMRPAQAAQFSFLLGLPTLMAATMYKLTKDLYKSHRDGTPNMFETLGLVPCLVGALVAAVSAAVAVKWLVAFLSKHGLMAFAWYRLALTAVLGGFIWAGVVTIEPPSEAAAATPTGKGEVVAPLEWRDAERGAEGRP
jgi:undecaprenyl-diphosphatase